EPDEARLLGGENPEQHPQADDRLRQREQEPDQAHQLVGPRVRGGQIKQREAHRNMIAQRAGVRRVASRAPSWTVRLCSGWPGYHTDPWTCSARARQPCSESPSGLAASSSKSANEHPCRMAGSRSRFAPPPSTTSTSGWYRELSGCSRRASSAPMAPAW